MDYFTWTDAKKYSKKEGNGILRDYPACDKIKYGCFCAVVCPDNTVIREPHYEGYGIFGGVDIFELIVDWNKDFLIEIFERIKKKSNDKIGVEYANEYANLALCYQNDDTTGFYKELEKKGFDIKTWKRIVGITISTGEDNERLKYPIKITTQTKGCYAELYPSFSCQ